MFLKVIKADLSCFNICVSKGFRHFRFKQFLLLWVIYIDDNLNFNVRRIKRLKKGGKDIIRRESPW